MTLKKPKTQLSRGLVKVRLRLDRGVDCAGDRFRAAEDAGHRLHPRGPAEGGTDTAVDEEKKKIIN